jgi:hypothetical protein
VLQHVRAELQSPVDARTPAGHENQYPAASKPCRGAQPRPRIASPPQPQNSGQIGRRQSTRSSITIAILFVLRGAARDIYRRLMDAVEPEVDKAEAALSSVNGVEAVDSLRLRWLGHRLRAETDVTVASTLNVVEGHAIAVEAQHRLLHDVPALTLPRFTSIRARPAATTPARPSRTTGDAASKTGARVS